MWTCHGRAVSQYLWNVMYAIYRELNSPTGVEHCIECNFFNKKQKSLVVAATSVLRVYNLRSKSNAAGEQISSGGGGQGPRLVQEAEYQLYGNVESLDSVRLTHSSRDALVLSFKEAKLSLVEYDPSTNDLRTVSLHYFEDDDIKGGLLHNYHHPYARVDPEGRCTAMLIYGSDLAVLPFRQGEELDVVEPTTPTSPTSSEGRDILASFTVSLRGLSEVVNNVKDFQFLCGYNNPTIFILYEATPTWAGRIALRRDTTSAIGLSLNMSTQSSDVIWQCHNLPFDASYCLAVPRPIGGMLVVGANTLLYLNQSSPSVGVALNSLAETHTSYQLRQPPGSLTISMDCSRSCFISPEQVVTSLRGGEIYILTLVPDGMRGIKNILFEKTAAAVLTSCVCKVGGDCLFLGSRLGNSLLLKFTRLAWDKEAPDSGNEGAPAAKRIKSEELLDQDELEVYGSESQSGGPSTLASYKFEVCDSLLNVGPIKDMALGMPAFLSEEFSGRGGDPELELVTCSGHGKNGALCVLQRSIRPQVVTTFELPGCSDMWTVCSNQSADGSVAGEHSFLLLSREDSTMVLQTGQEITELDSSGFATQCPTLHTANMGDGRFMIQVTGADVRLLSGTKLLCRIPLDMEGGVRSCDVTNSYAVVLLVSGTVALLELRQSDGEQDEEASLNLSWPELAKGSKVNLLSTYTDRSGLFLAVEEGSHAHKKKTTPTPLTAASDKTLADEEDELLYGSVDSLVESVKKKQSSMEVDSDIPSGKGETTPPSLTDWCLVCREDGCLEVYSVPSFKMVFCVRNFSSAPNTLMDSGPILLPSPHPGSQQKHSSEQSVNEILMTGLGPDHTHPYLMSLINKELVVYKAFPFEQTKNPGHLSVRFSKVHHKVLLSDHKASQLSKQLSQQTEDSSNGNGNGTTAGSRFTPQLRAFTDIAGYSGVFVCGSHPHWLTMTHRGSLTLHPMFIDGPVTSFAPFHNVNCPHGFLHFNAEGELRICVLPSHLSYDAPWPVRKVPTKATPHFVGFHLESKTHPVILSEQAPLKEIPVGDDSTQHEPVEKDEHFIFAMEDKFYLQLYSPTAWEPIPNARFDVSRFDRVVSMKVMQLRSQETASGRKEYIVIGTTSVCGEEVQCKGRILIFDVTEVIPEPGKPLTKHKLKCLYNEEQKGTISALADVDGLLVACMGQKIFMWNFKENKDLIGVAFIDTEIYIHKAVSVKNFILIADISRSIQLLRYQENRRTLSQISKDQFPSEIYSCDFMIDGQQLGFIASDSDQNLVLYHYQPEMPESYGGLYLVRRGDFNSGAHINSFLRVHCKPASLLSEKRHTTFFATLDGGIGYLLPIPEKTYRRLLMLQIKLVQGLPHTAGLNPKAFRMYHTHHQYLYTPQKNILDGELLWRYSQLSLKDKTDFAKQIGTSQSQVMEDLQLIDRVATHF